MHAATAEADLRDSVLTTNYNEIAPLVDPLYERAMAAYLADEHGMVYDTITELIRLGKGAVYYAVKRWGTTAARGLTPLQRAEVLAHAHIAEGDDEHAVPVWFNPFTGKRINVDGQLADVQVFLARFITAVVAGNSAGQLRAWAEFMTCDSPSATSAEHAINALIRAATRTYSGDLAKQLHRERLRHAHPAARTRLNSKRRKRSKH